jgi:hypothetical protein
MVKEGIKNTGEILSILNDAYLRKFGKLPNHSAVEKVAPPATD